MGDTAAEGGLGNDESRLREERMNLGRRWSMKKGTRGEEQERPHVNVAHIWKCIMNISRRSQFMPSSSRESWVSDYFPFANEFNKYVKCLN